MLDQMVDATPVLDNHVVVDVQEAALTRLIQDLAYNIHTAEDIAVRYGLGSIAGLKHFMLRHPNIVAKIAALRAIHNSETNRVERNRIKANVLVEEALPGIGAIAMDASKPGEIRLKAFNMLQRQAGVDGAPAADKTAAAGATFNLAINFADGQQKTITATTVVEPIAAIADAEDNDDKEFEVDA